VIPYSSTINKTQNRVLRRDFEGLEYIFNATNYDLNNLPNPKVENFDQDDVTLLARLIFGEARGESREVKNSIAYSVLNRTGNHKWWGHTLKEVILKPSQYTCFSQEDQNYNKIIDPLNNETPSVWRECVEVSHFVLSNPKNDTSNGATHYHILSVNPTWAEGKTPVCSISNTVFYKLDR
ncbi:cell wall hydrolase, partial [archaeon]|nr:cell wall hydrolase [archaeon]